MQTRIEYKWSGSTKHVNVAANGDVLELRLLLSEELGLPASQGLRLKCGTRDLRDKDPISLIDATVLVMLRGGLAGGTRSDSKRPREQEEASAEEVPVSPNTGPDPNPKPNPNLTITLTLRP